MKEKVNYLVEKSNYLNTLRNSDMSLTELRFFCLYLSRLNARNINTRTVNLPIKDFSNIFGVELNTWRFDAEIRKIMTRTIEIKQNGKKTILTLYSAFRYQEDNPKILEIICNDMLLPYLFELKKNYTTYIIGNIAKLNSVAKIRLYEIAKQYENIKNIQIPLNDLQEMLFNKTAQFKRFRADVLDPAIADINKFTDINLSYEKILKCRKVVALKLIIKSKDTKPKIEENVSAPTPASVPEQTVKQVEYSEELQSLYFKLNKEYAIEDLQRLYDLVTSSNILQVTKTTAFNYIVNVYNRIKASKSDIRNLYSYTLKIITNDIEHADEKNRLQEVQETPKPKKKKSSSYDDTPSYDLDNYIRGLYHKYREEPFPSTQKYYFHSNEVTTFDIHTILEKNFDIYDNNLYNIRSLQGLIDYIYKKYNVLLIDVNPTGEYDKLAFGER